MRRRKLSVLLAEDSPSDVKLFQVALERAMAGTLLWVAHDGAEVIAYLKGQGEFADRMQHPMPDVLITDLKMPAMDGIELLTWLQENPEYALIPTIMLSGSGLPEDVTRAYGLGVNAYIAKPTHLAEFVDVLRKTLDFWLVCERPVLPVLTK
jgi:two-component system, chemotaxis family, response regulator Rcp1